MLVVTVWDDRERQHRPLGAIRSDSRKRSEVMPEEVKSYIRTVQAGTERLRFLACQAKKGWSFYIQKQVVENKKTKTVERGGSKHFETLAEASKEVDAGVEAALKQGWSATTKVGGGFKAKADTFSLSNLPKPKATTK